MTSARPSEAARVSSLAERYDLSSEVVTKLLLLLQRLADDPLSPTAVRSPSAIIDHHLADSLVALELESVRRARFAVDVGSGAGLPGLPLAAALPAVTFVLLESAARKCAFLERIITASGITNAEVVNERSENYRQGLARHDLVTVRAVASLEVTAEYAAPLLRVGGTLVVWAGRRSPEREAGAARAAAELGLGELQARHVDPFPGARDRHLYVTSKVNPTPDRFPRRPGMALKRPLGAVGGPQAGG